MTDITDPRDPYAPKRPNNGRGLPLTTADVERINGEIRETHGLELVPAQQQQTRLQYIADAVSDLTYGEMKEFARGVLGADAKPEDVIALADKFYDWSIKTKGTAA